MTVDVLLLGAAQDGGFPQFGCFCHNCRQAYGDLIPSETAISLALIDRKAGKWFLVEAAPQLHEQWRRYAPQLEGLKLSGVLLTHAHTGHNPGLLFLGKESLNTSHVPVFASPAMHDFLQVRAQY